MKTLKLAILACFVAITVWTIPSFRVVEGQDKKGQRVDVKSEFTGGASERSATVTTNDIATESLAGWGVSLGQVSDEFPDFAVNKEAFNTDEFFDETGAINPAIGPVYNETGCGKCHGNPVIGGSSHVFEMRAGHFDSVNNRFVDHPGDSLIHSRSTEPKLQEQILAGNEVRAARGSLPIFGDGLLECIDSNDMFQISQDQPGQSGGRIQGQFIEVPVAEAGGLRRGGRFGWKNQNASLLSFAGDAYVNEMGITTPLFPNENTSNGRSVVGADTAPTGCVGLACLTTPDEEDNDDIEKFAAFMRALAPPPVDQDIAGTFDSQEGSRLFSSVGCNICHVRNFTTLPAGTVINRGAFTVPAALGNKVIHPLSDLLLHDIGTGDGIVQNGGQSTRNKVRTMPLWGLRVRNRFFHDGSALTVDDAIRRHAGEAIDVIRRYRGDAVPGALNSTQRRQILTFLSSL